MKTKILGIISHVVSVLPFMVTTSDGIVRLNGARIMEGVIIAVLAGLLSGYVAVKELSVKMVSVESQVTTLDMKINKLDDRLFNYIEGKKTEDRDNRHAKIQRNYANSCGSN